MKIEQINKPIYRKRLNQIIVAFIVGFAALAVLYGTILISLFAQQVPVELVDSAQQTSNFRYNLMGVILALITSAAVLHQLRNKAVFYEVYYIWRLKQIQNLIYRRLKKIKQASADGNVDALLVLHFYYESLKQLYVLDDNLITMPELEKDCLKLEELTKSFNIEINIEQFDKSLIEKF